MTKREASSATKIAGFAMVISLGLVGAGAARASPAALGTPSVAPKGDWSFTARHSVAVLSTTHAPVAYYVPAAPTRLLVLTFGHPWADGAASDAELLSYARTNLTRWTDFADRNHVLLMAPVLGGKNFLDFRSLSGRLIDPDSFVDALVDGPATAVIPRLGGRFCLHGHSAGAQFAARYIVAHPERLECAILSAPSTYPMPVTTVAWPYGMAWEAGSKRAIIGPKSWVEAATGAPITVIVGSNDLEERPPAPGQIGGTRLSRGEAWVASMQELARSAGRTPHVDFVTAPGLDHDEAAMANVAQNLLEGFYSSAKTDLGPIAAESSVPGSTSAACGLPLQTTTLGTLQWQDDVRAMVNGIERLHKNPFHHTPKATLEQAAADLESQIPNLAPEAIPVRISQIVALVGDGHTRLMEPPHPMYPIRTYWFGNELRVTSTTRGDEDLLGGVIKNIGDYDVQEVSRRVRLLVAQDENRWLEMNRTPSLLTDATVLWSLGISSAPDQVSLRVEREGKQISKTLNAVSGDMDQLTWIQPFSAVPRYLEHQNDDFWFETFTNTNTTYVIFNRYTGFAHHAQELLRSIADSNPDRLIIDMRENGGGDFGLPREYLLPYLKFNRVINRRGHLYIIIGRKTFSAAMTNATDFRKETNSILVGEPAGERPNSYQENGTFCLPNSHLHITVSTEYYRNVAGDPEALFPDKRIDISWSDYESGKDPVLSWILQQPVDE